MWNFEKCCGHSGRFALQYMHTLFSPFFLFFVNNQGMTHKWDRFCGWPGDGK